MKRRQVAFVVNPNSGADKKSDRISLLRSCIPDDVDYDIIEWVSPGQDLAAELNKKEYDIIAAVGGDGTVNCIAGHLTGKKTALAIIPYGSGNGLARHLHIPLNKTKAVKLLSKGIISSMDHCLVNDKSFFCTAGVGFDAEIGRLFAQSKKRGFTSYLSIILEQIRKYKPQEYELIIDGSKEYFTAFLITVANASQYGNNAHIAPLAQVNDGLMNVSILKPFCFYNVLGLGLRMFNQTIHKSKFVETRTGKEIIIRRKVPGAVHFDGEPMEAGNEIRFSIIPHNLKVLVPETSV